MFTTPPYECQFCGAPSWLDESEQTAPVDYCHPEDHGEPDEPQCHVVMGDCREALQGMPDRSINTVITSPPYFGLRDYGVDGQMGLEQTASEYIANLVSTFNEMFRVLRDDGVMFINMGDTYAGFKDGKFPPQSQSNGNQRGMPVSGAPHRNKQLLQRDGYKNKELMGIPWRFALAMQEAGWYLRQDIIWAKTNYTPEKVRDRFVRSHEHVFLFTKKDRYWFDGDAVRVPAAEGETKLRPDVWHLPVSKYKGAHFATFPPELVEPCLLAGCPEGGVVLDMFGGTGTVGGVAKLHNRNSVIVELNPDTVKLIPHRIKEIMENG